MVGCHEAFCGLVVVLCVSNVLTGFSFSKLEAFTNHSGHDANFSLLKG